MKFVTQKKVWNKDLYIEVCNKLKRELESIELDQAKTNNNICRLRQRVDYVNTIQKNELEILQK